MLERPYIPMEFVAREKPLTPVGGDSLGRVHDGRLLKYPYLKRR